MSPEKVQSPAISEYTEMSSEPQKDSKRKKSKSQDKHKKSSNEEDTRHRKSKKSKSKKEDKKSSYYEETAGISTPSKEILPELKNDIADTEHNSMNSVQQSIPYEKLAKNKVISMIYELRQIPHDSNRVILLICITNVGQQLAKELVFDVSDTSSLKLVRNVSVLEFFRLLLSFNGRMVNLLHSLFFSPEMNSG